VEQLVVSNINVALPGLVRSDCDIIAGILLFQFFLVTSTFGFDLVQEAC